MSIHKIDDGQKQEATLHLSSSMVTAFILEQRVQDNKARKVKAQLILSTLLRTKATSSNNCCAHALTVGKEIHWSYEAAMINLANCVPLFARGKSL
jgi:hypothetical protein